MRRTAFTLLEITLVLAVIAVVLALAAPRLSALRDRSAVRGAVDEIGASFSTARAAAIAQRTTVAVVSDTARGSIQVRWAGRSLVHRALGTTYGITLASNRDSAVYDARGLGYGLSNLTLVVRRGGMVDTLTMSRLGRVRW